MCSREARQYAEPLACLAGASDADLTLRLLAPRRRRGSCRRRRAAAGATVVEMAVVLPIFLLVVLSIIEFGRAMTVGQLITAAARHGARHGIVEHSTNSTVKQLVRDYCEQTLGVPPGVVDVAITVDPGPNSTSDPADQLANAQRGDICTVSIELPFDKVSYLPGKYLGNKRLSASCTMERE